jgi:hypothetical protein
VIHVVIVDGVSRDRPLRVDCPYEGALAGACARARSVERGDGAVAIAHEAVSHTARVNVISVNHSRPNSLYFRLSISGFASNNAPLDVHLLLSKTKSRHAVKRDG